MCNLINTHTHTVKCSHLSVLICFPPVWAAGGCSEGLYFLSFSFFFHLTYSRWTSSLPSCLWSQRIFPSLPGSRLTFFLSRCKFSTLTTRQPMVEFYLLSFPRFPLRKKEHKSYFGKNRTHDFRTSRCAAYLLDHSGDSILLIVPLGNSNPNKSLLVKEFSSLQRMFPLENPPPDRVDAQ